MGHASITRADGTEVTLGQTDPAMAPFRRWVADRKPCGSCPLASAAPVDPEAPDVDPEEPEPVTFRAGRVIPVDSLFTRPTDAATFAQWDHARTEGARA